jgi:putative ABC transport system ATP-binding protein
MLRFNNVSKVYHTRKGDVHSLQDLTLEVKTGEFLVIRGPSGCGKTTLLLTGGGMLHPSAGTVKLDGEDLYQLNAQQRAAVRAESVGFVFQMFHLVPYLNVLENVLLARIGSRPRAVRERAQQLLVRLGLEHRTAHTPASLSTGERQRTAVARALLNEPKVILADEPTGNLDPENGRQVFDHLKQFQRAGGTVIVVTHGDGADTYADRIFQMTTGRIGTP